MRQSPEQRRLLAILAADIVGYSRLMAENEADMFYRLKDLQQTLIVPATARNNGRIIKFTGDGFLAAFESAVDAVRAAVEIQSGAAAVGSSAPEDRRIRFRMGINAGDVIIVPGDVYGDTVNIAARLEGVAAPGGICISRGVRDTVRGKFNVEFEDRGALAVRNIPDPIGAFDVRFDPIAWTMGRDESSSSSPPRWLPWAAVGVLLVFAAGVAAWLLLGRPAGEAIVTLPLPAPTQVTGENGPAWRAELAARLASAVPSLDEKARDLRVRGYEAAAAHKAQAVSLDPPGTWRLTRPTAEAAEIGVLEACQVAYGQPCILLAVDNTVLPPPRDGNWPRRDMPRARYTGAFDMEQIPALRRDLHTRPEIVNYSTAAAPKAAAYHPWGRLFAVAGATTQRGAEEEALQACNTDPSRNGADGDCFLYAIGDQVVLPRRSKYPLTAATPMRDQLAARLASAAPELVSKRREQIAEEYVSARRHKAQAASPPPVVFWRAADRPSSENAEESALENCQVVSGKPCALVAVNEAVPPLPPGNAWPRRDMPRATYSGRFDPRQIPGTLPAVRQRADVLGYLQAPSPKAAAYHPAGGRVFLVTAATDQYAAEEAALKICAEDRPPYPAPGGCYLYAVGDQVVLPRRLRQPLTAPP